MSSSRCSSVIMCSVVWIGRTYNIGSNGMIIFYRQIQEIVGRASGSALCVHQALSHCCRCCSLLSLSTELCAVSQALSHCQRCCRVHSFCEVHAAHQVLWCSYYNFNCSSFCSAVSASLLAPSHSHLSCLSVRVILNIVEYGPLHPRGPIDVRPWYLLQITCVYTHMQNTRCICSCHQSISEYLSKWEMTYHRRINGNIWVCCHCLISQCDIAYTVLSLINVT